MPDVFFIFACLSLRQGTAVGIINRRASRQPFRDKFVRLINDAGPMQHWQQRWEGGSSNSVMLASDSGFMTLVREAACAGQVWCV